MKNLINEYGATILYIILGVGIISLLYTFLSCIFYIV